MMISSERNTNLANLLTSEDIVVEYEHTPTAYFDLKSRRVVLPIWKEGLHVDVNDMFIVHETGHAIFTPSGKKWKNAVSYIDKDNQLGAADYLNVVEDARVDRRMKDRYPGVKRIYYNAYQILTEKDFFGLKKRDKPIDESLFIDRANLFFKCGSFLPKIAFSQQEKDFIRRMGKTHEWKDVVRLAKEIYDYEKDKHETKKGNGEDKLDPNDKYFVILSKDYNPNSSNGQKFEIPDGYKVLIQENSFDAFQAAKEETNKDCNGKPIKIDGIARSKIGGSIGEMELGYFGENLKFSSELPDGHPNKGSGKVSNGNSNGPVSMTMNEWEFKLRELADKTAKQNVYIGIPKINSYKCIESFSKVTTELSKERDKYKKNKFERELNKVLKNNKKNIAYMAQQFEMKKAADMYAKIGIAKTGILNMTKIHTYKYNEDLFKKSVIIPKGKNHSLFILLDWSGSMNTVMSGILEQLMILVFFCKKVKIPYEVFAFSSVQAGDISVDYKDKDMVFGNFKLIQLLSSKMNTSQNREAMLNIAYLKKYFDEPREFSLPDAYRTGSTPLNASIVALYDFLPKYVRENNIQINNIVILTDGDSDGVTSVYKGSYSVGINYSDNRNHLVIRDRLSGQEMIGYHHSDITKNLLALMKYRMNVNVLGFYICSMTDTNIKSIINSKFHDKITDESTFDEYKNKLVNDKHLICETQGYDQYYIIPINKGEEVKDSELTSSDDFASYLKSKKVNRIVLNKFIEKIAI